MLVLVLAAILSVAVFTAQAATVPENVEWIELGSKEDFLNWFGGGTKGKHMTENYTAGMTRYYKLTADITIDQDSTVYYLSSGTYQVNTYIDLNDKTLTYTSPKDSATRFFGTYNANTTHTFVNGTIVNNSKINSNGAMFIVNAGKMIMEDVDIYDNAVNMTYAYSGKVFSAVGAGNDLTLTNVNVTSGATTANNYGLIIRSEKNITTLKNCTFTSTSTEAGRTAYGGILYQAEGTLNIDGCTFQNGYGKYGGNVYANKAAVTIKNSNFTGGKVVTSGYGGNVLLMACTSATVEDTSFSDGVGKLFGGNLFNQDGPLTVKGCTFTGGTAENGGSFFTVNKPVTMENCTLTGGKATVSGGNILAKNSTFTMVGTTVTGGTAAVAGGNICCANSVTATFTSGKISGGKAANGGNIGTANPTGNRCYINIENVEITGGTATGNGGNIAAITEVGYAGYPTVNIKGGTISAGKAANGANVYVAGAAKEAATADKAAIAQRTALLNISGGEITGGVATTNGGNIYAVYATATMTAGKVTKGEAVGGGNIFGTNATVTVSGGEVLDGYASDLAGSIYPSTACTVNISGTAVISGGTAKDRGGNFYLSSTNSVLNITGGTVKDGVGYRNGGNIFANNGKITITGGVVSGGYTEASGGNIYASMGYGSSALNASLTIKDDGDAATPIPQIIDGVALGDGGNIYAAFGGNSDKLIGKLILGNAIISGGDAKNMGDDLFMNAHTILEILPEFAQDLSCYIAYSSTNSMIADGVYGKAFANGRGISTGDFTGSFTVENYENTIVFAKDGTLYFAGAATVAADGVKTWYKSNADAVAAYADVAYLQAAAGVLELLGGEYIVDLAGNAVAITGTGAVTLFDSENDDFDGFGTATIDGVTLRNTAMTRVLNKDYYTLASEGTYSFHRIQAQLTNVSLRPSTAGIYFTAKWNCDETVKPLIGTFGIVVSLTDFAGADFANNENALYTVFGADAFEGGVQKNGVMIEGILKALADDVAQERVAMNSIYAQMAIFAEAYITIDGTTYTGIGASYSLYDIMKIVADQINEYYADAATMQAFMTFWSGNGLVGEPWDSLNFQVSEDVMTLNTLYAGLQPYYGELHDHANTGGSSDGKQTLDVWKSELERLEMDFATIVDHRQSSHMYLDEWDNSVFIGGSEAACRITTRSGVYLHYNLIFSDPKGLEAVVSSFPEFNWKYYPEDYSGTNAAKLAGGWHFDYPSFTAERFTEVCAAVYANGGFVALVHPKADGYIDSTNPADAYFYEGTGIEVFYTYLSTRDGYLVKRNYQLWTDMLKAGFRVYATAGNDEHAMPSDKACSVIYSGERSADAWVEQMRNGTFIAGGVGIRSAIGDAVMGGSTSFAGKRFTFSVGDFHKSLFNPGHTYRIDVLDQNGVVFTQEIDCTETTYMAFTADNASDYYYIEVYDVTNNSLIAIGNPIWNDK